MIGEHKSYKEEDQGTFVPVLFKTTEAIVPASDA